MPLFSIYALLIYFGILREENDIDLMLEKGPMYDRLFIRESREEGAPKMSQRVRETRT